MNHSSPRGFTLIELLVVIAIIGVLSSVVLTSVSKARQNANDARRITDLKELQKALELFAVDNAGTYPVTSATHAWSSECNSGTPVNSMIPNLVSGKYISSIPADPDMDVQASLSASTCCYLYASDGTNYKLMVGENCPVSNYANVNLKSLLDPARTSTVKDWAVYTPGAASW